MDRRDQLRRFERVRSMLAECRRKSCAGVADTVSSFEKTGMGNTGTFMGLHPGCRQFRKRRLCEMHQATDQISWPNLSAIHEVVFTLLVFLRDDHMLSMHNLFSEAMHFSLKSKEFL